MGKFKVRMFVLLGALVVLAGSAFADVPSNLIVNAGGLQWVWASPCAPIANTDCPTANSLNLTDGWSIPTSGQWLASFTNTADVYNTFTMNGTGQLCASPYFSSGLSNCDSDDVQAGFIWGAPDGISDSSQGGATNGASDAFLVRNPCAPAVPEPSSMLLLGSGALGVVQSIRRKLRR